ncbi:hypothetical protein APA_2055 [Pseudanabaena sp. lw0831]|uniref:hypothetical protein n=1 Tax=Pseudanabaena sp. lw0831 TaxID=1357935 RepID=UPI001915E557|nr:hypothetical protein [Pseudanabaena sp. lw0831]GBO54107.1 hypothetical protein APA_2055 [Pseudanabaena sp. lw0831]
MEKLLIIVLAIVAIWFGGSYLFSYLKNNFFSFNSPSINIKLDRASYGTATGVEITKVQALQEVVVYQVTITSKKIEYRQPVGLVTNTYYRENAEFTAELRINLAKATLVNDSRISVPPEDIRFVIFESGTSKSGDVVNSNPKDFLPISEAIPLYIFASAMRECPNTFGDAASYARKPQNWGKNGDVLKFAINVPLSDGLFFSYKTPQLHNFKFTTRTSMSKIIEIRSSPEKAKDVNDLILKDGISCSGKPLSNM